MTRIVCKQGEMEPGTTTMTLERDNTIVVFKHAPAEVCDTCGEAYIDTTTKRLLDIVEEAAKSGVQVDVRSYAA